MNTCITYIIISFYQTELMIVSLFVTPDNGILIQDSFAMDTVFNNMMGLEAPYYYFMKKVCWHNCYSTVLLCYFCYFSNACSTPYSLFEFTQETLQMFYDFKYFVKGSVELSITCCRLRRQVIMPKMREQSQDSSVL